MAGTPIVPAFGRSMRRKEDRSLPTGRGCYTHDLILPAQTHAAFVRSPYAHATPLGAHEFDMPATPAKVWRVISEQGL